MTKDFQRYMKIIRNTHHDLLKVKNWPTILIKKRKKKMAYYVIRKVKFCRKKELTSISTTKQIQVYR